MTILGHHTSRSSADWISTSTREMGRVDAVAQATCRPGRPQDRQLATGVGGRMGRRLATTATRAARVSGEVALPVEAPLAFSQRYPRRRTQRKAVLHALSKTAAWSHRRLPGSLQSPQPIALAQGSGRPLESPQPKQGTRTSASCRRPCDIRGGERRRADAVLRAGKDLAPSKGTATVVIVGLRSFWESSSHKVGAPMNAKISPLFMWASRGAAIRSRRSSALHPKSRCITSARASCLRKGARPFTPSDDWLVEG